jgi:hypothetical protein
MMAAALQCVAVRCGATKKMPLFMLDSFTFQCGGKMDAIYRASAPTTSQRNGSAGGLLHRASW